MPNRTFTRIGLSTLVALLVLLSGLTSSYAQPRLPEHQKAEDPAGATDRRKPAKVLPTIVLVHGAWDNATGWNDIVERLQARGYPVIAPPNQLRDLASDAAYVSSILTTIAGPVVLVGHSYGGAVITNAAVGHSNVKALVYIAAFVPDEGESLLQLSSINPGSELGESALVPRPYPLTPDTVGIDLYLTQQAVQTVFAPDVPRRVADRLFATQRPLAQAAFVSASGAPAWKTIPSWYLVASEDRAIPPARIRARCARPTSRTCPTRRTPLASSSKQQTQCADLDGRQRRAPTETTSTDTPGRGRCRVSEQASVRRARSRSSPQDIDVARLGIVLRICSSDCACASAHIVPKASSPSAARAAASARSTSARSTGRIGVPIRERSADAPASMRAACAASPCARTTFANPSRARATNRRGPTARANRSASASAAYAAAASLCAHRIAPCVISTSDRHVSAEIARNSATLSWMSADARTRSRS
jgi:pimeloyl-ACP methyl ester carboxylesterase